MPNQNTIFQLKIRKPPPKKKSRHEKEAKKLNLSLSHEEMNNHSCYISQEHLSNRCNQIYHNTHT
jgi:hypothetical protein